MEKKENTGDNGEVSTASVSTQSSPTFSRADLGAVVSNAKVQQNSETAPNKLQGTENKDGVLFCSLDSESDNVVDNAEIGTRSLSDREKVAKVEEVYRSMHPSGTGERNHFCKPCRNREVKDNSSTFATKKKDIETTMGPIVVTQRDWFAVYHGGPIYTIMKNE